MEIKHTLHIPKEKYFYALLVLVSEEAKQVTGKKTRPTSIKKGFHYSKLTKKTTNEYRVVEFEENALYSMEFTQDDYKVKTWYRFESNEAGDTVYYGEELMSGKTTFLQKLKQPLSRRRILGTLKKIEDFASTLEESEDE